MSNGATREQQYRLNQSRNDKQHNSAQLNALVKHTINLLEIHKLPPALVAKWKGRTSQLQTIKDFNELLDNVMEYADKRQATTTMTLARPKLKSSQSKPINVVTGYDFLILLFLILRIALVVKSAQIVKR